MGYAFVGISRRNSAPAEEPFGSNSVLYVEVPYDVLMRYFWRAEERSLKIHPATRLAWLRAHDEAERTKWVDSFRNSNATLGSVIAEVFMQREASWDPPVETPRLEYTVAAPEVGENTARQTQDASSDHHRNIEWSPTTVGGAKFCSDFQTGSCRSRVCKKGLHQCAFTMPHGKPCGARGPGTSRHRTRNQ